MVKTPLGPKPISDRASSLSAEWADRIATIGRVSHLITASASLDEMLETAIEAINTYLHYSNITGGFN